MKVKMKMHGEKEKRKKKGNKTSLKGLTTEALTELY